MKRALSLAVTTSVLLLLSGCRAGNVCINNRYNGALDETNQCRIVGMDNNNYGTSNGTTNFGRTSGTGNGTATSYAANPNFGTDTGYETNREYRVGTSLNNNTNTGINTGLGTDTSLLQCLYFKE
jgi:hypothetical protein